VDLIDGELHHFVVILVGRVRRPFSLALRDPLRRLIHRCVAFRRDDDAHRFAGPFDDDLVVPLVHAFQQFAKTLARGLSTDGPLHTALLSHDRFIAPIWPI